MGPVKLFATPQYISKQPRDAVAPQVPCTGIFLGPSKSGKTIALISAILEQYRTADGSSVFERIFIFSPSIEIDDGWKPVKEFIENEMGVNTEREQVYFDKWDEGALRTIIEQQKKITRTSKQLGLKKLYQVLVVIDDFADQPELHRRTGDGALDTLFIRGRHMQISTWVSSQKLRLRVKMQFICIWRRCWKSSAPCCRSRSSSRCTRRPPGALQLLVHLLRQGQGQHVLQALGGVSWWTATRSPHKR